MPKAARKNSASKSAKRRPRPGPRVKGRPRGKAFQPGNPWRIQPGEVRNPTGRPRLLSDTYREWLEALNADGIPNAAGVAVAMGQKALRGDIGAARELRQATEGDKFSFDLSKLSDEQLQRLVAGEDPRAVLATPGPGGDGAAPAPDPGGAEPA